MDDVPALVWWLVGGGAALLLIGLLLWTLSAALERRARRRAVQPAAGHGRSTAPGAWRVLPGRPSGFGELGPEAATAATATYDGAASSSPTSAALPPLDGAPKEAPAHRTMPAPAASLHPPTTPLPAAAAPTPQVEPAAPALTSAAAPADDHDPAEVVDLRDTGSTDAGSLADLPPPVAGVRPDPSIAPPVRGRRHMVMLSGLGEPVVVESLYGADNSPGWYLDPAGSGRLRWWDGSDWTEHLE